MGKLRLKNLCGKDYIFINATVANPINTSLKGKIEFLVDTGAEGCAIPEEIMKKLKLEDKGSVEAVLADGSVRQAGATYILLEIAGKKLYTWAIYGRGFEPLLGIDVMKVLGIHIDVPDKNTLIPIRALKVKRLRLKKYTYRGVSILG
jgi:clan AA aspartic protease